MARRWMVDGPGRQRKTSSGTTRGGGADRGVARTRPSGSVAAAGTLGLPLRGDASWQPEPETFDEVDTLIRGYRGNVVACLEPPVQAHYPELLATPEYARCSSSARR